KSIGYSVVARFPYLISIRRILYCGVAASAHACKLCTFVVRSPAMLHAAGVCARFVQNTNMLASCPPATAVYVASVLDNATYNPVPMYMSSPPAKSNANPVLAFKAPLDHFGTVPVAGPTFW